MIRIVGIFILALFFQSCEEEKTVQREGVTKQRDDRAVLMEHTSDINKEFTEQDIKDIEQYLSVRDWKVQQTGTGLYYYVFESYDSLRPGTGDKVLVGYQVSLLNGTVVYSSDKDGDAEVVIDRDDVESGLHEALKMLGVGDKGVFIMPYHRAHGLLGDSDEIDPLTVVVYRLELKLIA